MLVFTVTHIDDELKVRSPAPLKEIKAKQPERLPLYIPNFVKRNGRIDAKNYENVRRALGALGICYLRFYDSVEFEGRDVILWKPNQALDHLWFSIEKHFGFRPTKRFLVDVIREVREEVFADKN